MSFKTLFIQILIISCISVGIMEIIGMLCKLKYADYERKRNERIERKRRLARNERLVRETLKVCKVPMSLPLDLSSILQRKGNTFEYSDDILKKHYEVAMQIAYDLLRIIDDSDPKYNGDQVDELARVFLMPEQVVEYVVKQLLEEGKMVNLSESADQFGVSMDVAAARLEELNLSSVNDTLY